MTTMDAQEKVINSGLLDVMAATLHQLSSEPTTPTIRSTTQQVKRAIANGISLRPTESGYETVNGWHWLVDESVPQQMVMVTRGERAGAIYNLAIERSEALV